METIMPKMRKLCFPKGTRIGENMSKMKEKLVKLVLVQKMVGQKAQVVNVEKENIWVKVLVGKDKDGEFILSDGAIFRRRKELKDLLTIKKVITKQMKTHDFDLNEKPRSDILEGL